MDPLERAELVAGRGLAGNANQGGHRQVTLLSAERWRETCTELGADLDPRLRRANLFVAGLDLPALRGRLLAIGDCRILVRGEVRPCHQMDAAYPGLRLALDPDVRGGVYGEVVTGGEIAIDDPVRWLDPPP